MTLVKRSLLPRGFSLGALTLLTGCDISDNDAVQSQLARFSRWNYRARQAPNLDPTDYRLMLSGKIANKKPWTFDELHALPQVTQITRHVCVEGWSMIGKWIGTPLGAFLRRIGADAPARHVGFECSDGYCEGIDMPTALHPQPRMAFKLADETLSREHGLPFKLRIPTKLGFKNPKFITAIYVTDKQPRGDWPGRGYNWFSGS